MQRIEIIAEAGINHNGSPGLAYKLIDAAKEAGADVVKFQTFNIEKLLRPDDPDRWMLSQLTLPRNEFIRLAQYCETVGIEFMSTPGDLESLKFLVEEVGVKRLKIGSDDLTYAPLLESATVSSLPVILSTGMARMGDIRNALDSLNPERVTLLHCVSAYPTNSEDANLLAIQQLREFGLPVGYSDHTMGPTACIVAAALGAIMIEKHITLNARNRGPDHIVSLEPIEFKYMVECVRQVEKMLGHGRKEPCLTERENIARFRKDRDGFRGLLS